MNTRGRPREFDETIAVDAVLAQFWQAGYAATSLSDLCDATGLAKPSLYAAFGNKEGLFLTALAEYQARHVHPALAAMQAEPDARLALRRLFDSLLNRPHLAPGCLILQNLAETTLPESLTTALHQAAQLSHHAIAQRLQRAQHEGQLPPETNLSALQSWFDLLFAGLATLARTGTPTPNLTLALDLAFAAWPHPEKFPKT